MNRIININGKLQPLPKTLSPVENTEAYTTSELKKLGFKVYDYVEPTLNTVQRKGDLIITKGKATHEVVDLYENIEQLAEIKKSGFKEFSSLCQSAFRERKDYYTFRNKPLPEEYEALKIRGIAGEEEVNSKIDQLVESGDFETLNEFDPFDEEKTNYLNLIKSI